MAGLSQMRSRSRSFTDRLQNDEDEECLRFRGIGIWPEIIPIPDGSSAPDVEDLAVE